MINSSFHGKSHALNTFVLPLLWYVLKILDPPHEFVEKVIKSVLKFLWGGRRHWVPQKWLFLPKDQGGLGIFHPLAMTHTFRISFLQKCLQSKDDSYFLSH